MKVRPPSFKKYSSASKIKDLELHVSSVWKKNNNKKQRGFKPQG